MDPNNIHFLLTFSKLYQQRLSLFVRGRWHSGSNIHFLHKCDELYQYTFCISVMKVGKNVLKTRCKFELRRGVRKRAKAWKRVQQCTNSVKDTSWNFHSTFSYVQTHSRHAPRKANSPWADPERVHLRPPHQRTALAPRSWLIIHRTAARLYTQPTTVTCQISSYGKYVKRTLVAEITADMGSKRTTVNTDGVSLHTMSRLPFLAALSTRSQHISACLLVAHPVCCQ